MGTVALDYFASPNKACQYEIEGFQKRYADFGTQRSNIPRKPLDAIVDDAIIEDRRRPQHDRRRH
jgi:hypothetical protein